MLGELRIGVEGLLCNQIRRVEQAVGGRSGRRAGHVSE